MVQNDSLNEIIKISFNGNLFALSIFEIVYHSTNSFIQWVYLIWWVISKMMMKNFDDQSWNHHNKIKINPKHRKWWKRMHFVDVKKVYFHKIVLDEWKGMNFMDFNQLHSFLIFIQIEWILWKLMNLSKLNDQRYSYHSHVQSKNLLRFQHSFSL